MSLTLERKGKFIDLLFSDIKSLNRLLGEAQLIYSTISSLEIRTSFDLINYISMFSEQQNSRLLIAFEYEQNAADLIDFHDHILNVLQTSYEDCNISDEGIAVKSAHLAL